MKIAMLTNNYKPFVGGVPISVERLAKELRKQGHKVTVFAPDYGFDPRYGQVEEDDVIRFQVTRQKMENGMVYPSWSAEKSGKDLRNTSLTAFMCISRCLWERRHCILDGSIRSRLFIRITHGMKTTCIIFRFSEKSRQGCGEKS